MKGTHVIGDRRREDITIYRNAAINMKHPYEKFKKVSIVEYNFKNVSSIL